MPARRIAQQGRSSLAVGKIRWAAVSARQVFKTKRALVSHGRQSLCFFRVPIFLAPCLAQLASLSLLFFCCPGA